MQNFENKNVVITGGTSGIGLAAVKLFAEKGANVFFTGRNKELITAAEEQTGATGLLSDQSDLAAIDTLVQTITKNNRKVDVLFINAGVYAVAPSAAVTETHYDTIMNINLKGAVFTLQKFIPHLEANASVIFLSSISASSAMEGTAIYAASKAGLNAVAKVAAIELAPLGVRVNIVSPGPVDTPLWGKVGLSPEQLQQVAGIIQEKVPLKKFGSAEEIAKAVVFLASDESSFTTGSELVVAGGFNLNRLVG
ncbi:MAG: SDR family oxidoreductase [Bacteroidetes bacterium]|nr:SDR family oxidoreductase [Bacteroidota bacterium]